jgi:thiol-disulfide isomerase/thioredoxin
VKPSRLILIATALVVVAAAALGVLYWKSAKPVQPGAEAGPPAALAPFAAAKTPQPVPQVAFGNGAGARVELISFKGKYVLLNLWATWCAPCVRELPALAKLKATVPGHKFEVVAVDVGRGSAADSRSFLDAHGAKALATYVDSNLALLRAFGAYGLPLTILIDPKGHEIGRAVGPAAWDTPDSVRYFTDLSKS